MALRLRQGSEWSRRSNGESAEWPSGRYWPGARTQQQPGSCHSRQKVAHIGHEMKSHRRPVVTPAAMSAPLCRAILPTIRWRVMRTFTPAMQAPVVCSLCSVRTSTVQRGAPRYTDGGSRPQQRTSGWGFRIAVEQLQAATAKRHYRPMPLTSAFAAASIGIRPHGSRCRVP